MNITPHSNVFLSHHLPASLCQAGTSHLCLTVCAWQSRLRTVCLAVPVPVKLCLAVYTFLCLLVPGCACWHLAVPGCAWLCLVVPC